MTLEVDRLNRRIRRLRQAALRYRQQLRGARRLVEGFRGTVDTFLELANEAERQRDAHAEREVVAQKQLLEVESRLSLAEAVRGGEAPDAIREHVKEGLADSAAGRVSSLGSFAQYAETEAAKALADTGAKCATCEKPAACVGRYEAMEHFEPACDECCGHGCEDGRCYPVATAPPSAPDDAKEKALVALRHIAYADCDLCDRRLCPTASDAIAALDGKS